MIKKKHQLPCTTDQKSPKRRKTSDFVQLTSDPTSLSVFLKKIETDNGDIIQEYLSECNGDELVSLLETGYYRKANELAVILKVLATIVVRTRTDLADLYAATGRKIAETLLEETPLDTCFRALKPQYSAEAAKASLQLLAAIVSTDPILLGRSLLRSINFDHPDWIQLSRRRNTKDATDVRTCFINFIASFLVSDNNLLIRELVDSKNAIALLISECFTDKLHNVLLILTLLRTKVIENPTVSKTTKMRVFTRSALKQLAYLYAYRGEALSAKVALSRSDIDVDGQAVEVVRGTVHKLLHPLTSSSLTGIVFKERTSADGSKQNEHLLSLLLSPPMENQFMDNLRRELTTDCLLACPGLLPAYLTHWAPSLVPRDSDNWHRLMDFINQLFMLFQKRLVDRVSQLLRLSQDMRQFVQEVCDICLPPLCIVEPLRLATKHQSRTVVNTANTIYKSLRQNMAIFLTWLNTTDELKAKGVSSNMIIKAVVGILPERILVTKWFSRFSKTINKDYTDKSLLKDQLLKPPEADDEAEVEQSAELPAEPDNLSFTEDELTSLPDNFQPAIRLLLELSRNSAKVITQNEEQMLTQVWPEMAFCCLDNYWQRPLVYACLAAAVRLFSRSGSSSGWRGEEVGAEGSLSPGPKKLARLISKKATFLSILTEKPTGPVDEQSELLSLSRLKNGLVNLLLALGEVDPTDVAKAIPLVTLLAAYHGSLSLCDRRILQLIYLLDLGGHTMSSIWGMSSGCVLWGERLSDNYRFGSILKEVPTLWREPKAGVFLSILDKDRLLRTALSFPATRRCLARSASVEDDTLESDLYDPCFLLPLFLHYLSPGESDAEGNHLKVDLRGFYVGNGLALAIGALSSYSRHIRALARAVIARFRGLSDLWKPNRLPNTPIGLAVLKQFPERVQLNFILDTLRNSLSTKANDLGGGPRCRYLFGSKSDTSFRLTRIHANFFIHSLGMLTKPEHRMYEVFWNTFMAKPSIDLGTVPDFIRIAFSVHKDFRVERQWIVKLCADSVKDTSDYLLLEKSRVYKYCLLLYADPGCDATTQIQILRLFTATTRISRACHALTRFHAFPLWLFRHALSTTHAQSLCYFITIISQMLKAFEDSSESSRCLSMLRLLNVTFRKIHDESTFAKRKIRLISL